MPYMTREIDHVERVLVSLISICALIIAVDSGRVPYTSATLWAVFYVPASISAVLFATTSRLVALQMLVVFGGLPGLARAFLYLLGPEHRLAPVGINGMIAVLFVLYHRARRLDAR